MNFSWQDIWRLVKRWWWLAIIGVGLAGSTSYYFASKKDNLYAARTRLMVGSSILSTNPNSRDFSLSITLAQAYAEMARQRPVTQGVVERLQLPMGWWDLVGMVQTRVIPSAQLLEITVIHTNADFAALAANAVAEELIRQSPASSQDGIDRDFVRLELAGMQAKIESIQMQLTELQNNMVSLTSATELEGARTQLAELEQLRLTFSTSYVELASVLNTQSPNTLTIVDPASPIWNPIAPNPKKEAMMAAVAGLALAVAAVLVLEFADDTLRIQDDGAESLMGLPILGRVARMSNGRCEPHSPAAEMIRQLRTKVMLASPSGRLKSLVVTSPMPRDGKTVVAANLGVAMAAGGARVVFVDADLRAPALHEWLDRPNVAGLTEVLSTDAVQWDQLLPQLLCDTHVPGLSLLPAGRPTLDPSVLLISPRMSELLERLSQQFDFVLFDSPPVMAAPDATILATLAEGTLFVTCPVRTSRKITNRSKDKLLSRKDTHLIGFALNRMPLRRQSYKYTYRKEIVPQRKLPTLLPRKLSQTLSSLPVIGRPADPDLISLAQAASILGVHRNTVKRWCKEDRLPAVRKNLRWWVRQSGLQSTLLNGLSEEVSLPALDGSDVHPTSENLQQPTAEEA